MKIFSMMLILTAGLLLQGCAQLPASDTAVKPDYDVGKVAAIERYALQNNMRVIWINFPQARSK
ncbi:MAG: hypothetical protein WCD07_09295 [Burkholderiales bacterium]